MSGQPRDPAMAQLDAEFQKLIAKMNSPESTRGTEALFSSTPGELGEAAAKATLQRKERSQTARNET